MSDYIYLRTNEYWDEYDGYKLGRTCDISNRESNYVTSEILRGNYEMVIEITDDHFNSIIIERILQKYFKNYHIYINGAKEIYNKQIKNEIIELLNKTCLKFRVLTKEEIDDFDHKQRIELLTKIFQKKKSSYRNKLQKEYINDLVKQLLSNNRVFMKAPTGFGKTHVYFKLIKELKLNRILCLTPRRNLNIQITDERYIKYIKDDNYDIIHYSHNNLDEKETIIKQYANNNKKFIMTACYQSSKQMLEFIKQYQLKFDIIIFDEAHFITNWIDTNNEFLMNDNITTYKLFGSATPTDDIEMNIPLFGNIIEKVKIHQLINNKVLCDIETLVKKLDNKKKEYHNLCDLIISNMVKYNKRKGIIYVNQCENAETLYKLLNKQKVINTYIYTSKKTEDENKIIIEEFEQDTKPAVVIAVGKISYGYDNEDIDFICLGDPRQSDIDIRQIIGRGLRYNKENYPDKVLHMMIPLYKDEFDRYPQNQALKNYLNYIIGECDKDIIFKADNMISVSKSKDSNMNANNYEGDEIPSELLLEYCTTGYNKFTDFMRFLRRNEVYDELSYNGLRKTNIWMPIIGKLKEKYPKFCFRDIDKNKYNYYDTKNEVIKAISTAQDKLKIEIGYDKFSDLTQLQLMNQLNKIDCKIPNVDFDLYYP